MIGHQDPALPAVTSRQQWRHRFGEMLIEICVDGTVLIDGTPVADTVPQAAGVDVELQIQAQPDPLTSEGR